MNLEEMVSFCKNYGFIFQGSEIYGGLANTWDYGPLGNELKKNVKKAWFKKFIQENQYNVALDSAILMNPKVWEASGHINNFNDPLIDCKECQARFRADKMIEENAINEIKVDGWANEKMYDYIINNKIKCPKCGSLNYTKIRNFNMMFKTYQGVTEDNINTIYLRPETAQGIFVNFLNVQRSMRLKIPFGVGQIGKSFRNEITPGNFIFRTREFEQMELQFFCKPGTEKEWFQYWKDYCYEWLIELGINKNNIRFREHSKDELSHYSNATTDFEYKFPFGFEELWGLTSRTDFDLKQHQEYSKKRIEYLDPITNEKYIPYVVEPSLGVDRMVLAFLFEAYTKEKLDNDEFREVMKFHPALAPYKVAVFPLMKKRHRTKAFEIYQTLSKHFMTSFDDTSNIGKLYRRADIIGTPYAITIDDETLNNNTVTIRDRDTMEQVVLPLAEVIPYLNEKLFY